MKKIHLLPNVMTAFGLTCGLFVIFKMNLIALGGVDEKVLTSVAGILLLAAVADLLDGAIARAINAQSEFGGFFDSLSDAITFGVSPSVIVLKSFVLEPGSELSFLLTTAAMVFSVCGVLRLVRFSVMSQVSKGNEELTNAHNKHFTGLPIPAAAAAAVSANLFLVSNDFHLITVLSEQARAWVMLSLMIVIGYFMVSRWKFPSLKTLNLRVASFRVVFLTVLSAVLIFYGILYHFAVVFFVITWGYILTALILSIARMIAGKRLKTLAEFEPEPDELEGEDWEE